jgi:hypothetical protein
MANELTPAAETLPPGETDPNLLYMAVGRAIHAWESMEEALAQLYLKFKSIPFNPAELAAYGKEHRRFADRKDALEQASREFFVGSPDQETEGQFRFIVAELDELAIERHRIAHGHISMWGGFKLPEKKGYFEVTTQMKYRWAAPWYSTANLRTDPVGKNAEAINAVHDRFSALHNQITALKDAL